LFVPLASGTGATVPTTVFVPSGSPSATFTITATGVDAQTPVTIYAGSLGWQQTATLTVKPAVLVAFSLMPYVVVGGTPSKGTVTLSGPAGPSGALVQINLGIWNAFKYTTVTVPPAQSYATFTIKTSAQLLGDYYFTATMNGVSKTAGFLYVLPTMIQSVTFTPPSSCTGGQTVTGTVTLTNPAPTGGIQVFLSSSNSKVAIPYGRAVGVEDFYPWMFIPQGETKWTFSVKTLAFTTPYAGDSFDAVYISADFDSRISVASGQLDVYP
jgi:hypothetical protein